MSKTVLITGTSSGIGRAAALLFVKKGWNVIATMRSPEKEVEFKKIENILVLKLDVTDKNSIEAAIKAGIEKFGNIDVLVNNAGYGLIGPFEGVTDEQVGRQFATNIGGVLACTKAILPYFRIKKSGTVINITSMGGRITFPYYSLYHATKWAVDGFSEGLSYELKQFGVKVKVVEPGSTKSDFYDRSPEFTLNQQTENYKAQFETVQKQYLERGKNGTSPEEIAKVIYRAASDESNKLRYKAGSDAIILLLFRKILPERLFIWVIGKIFGI